MAYISRVLPPEEWPRLDGTGTDLAAYTSALDPETCRIVVVEDEGRIVASMVLIRQVLAEALWIDPAYRHRPGVGSKLLKGFYAVSQALGARSALSACMTDTMSGILRKLGATSVPALMFIIPLRGDLR